VFEDGHLTDGLGSQVNFKNTIIIADVEHRARCPEEELMGFSQPTRCHRQSVSDMVLGEVKRTFNPEFINRIDEIIVFEALSDEDLRRIMALLVTQLNDNLVDRKLRIALSPEVVDWIIEVTCKDRSYGARPLRRAIQRYVEDPLSEELIRGHLHGGEIEVYLDAGQLAYRLENSKRAVSCLTVPHRVIGYLVIWQSITRCHSLVNPPAESRSTSLRSPTCSDVPESAGLLALSWRRWFARRRPGAVPALPVIPFCGQKRPRHNAAARRVGSGRHLRAVLRGTGRHVGHRTANLPLLHSAEAKLSVRGVWIPRRQHRETLLQDFKTLWATNFLDNLWIDVTDYKFPNGTVGKVIAFNMEERQRVKIVDYVGSKKIEVSKID
jgi:hypothetical protein